MHYKFIQPTAELAPYIHHYWMMETGSTENSLTERVIPNGAIELMLHYKAPFMVERPDGITFQQPCAFLSGISSTWVDVTAEASSGMIAVSFKLAAAYRFFNFPLLETAGGIIDLSDLSATYSQRISDRIYSANSLDERINIIEQELLAVLHRNRTRSFPQAEAALAFLIQSGGAVDSRELADMFSTTTKSLERQFSTLIGKTPKQFGKIVRFKNVLKNFYSGKDTSLISLAHSKGYFDQAHLIKDFREFTGHTPKDFFVRYFCDPEFL